MVSMLFLNSWRYSAGKVAPAAGMCPPALELGNFLQACSRRSLTARVRS